MPSFDLYFFLRLAVGLTLGFFIVYRTKGILRALVVRSMPVRHRISEKSYLLQTRISTVLAFVLALTVGLLTEWGLREAAHALGLPTTVEQPEAQDRSASVEQVPAALPLPEPKPSPEPEPVPRDTLVAPSQPKTKQPSPVSAPTAEPYYLQLYAFRRQDFAEAAQAALSKALDQPVRLAERPGDTEPYKIMAGPFPSRAAAVRYGKRRQLNGFPRPAEGLQFRQDR